MKTKVWINRDMIGDKRCAETYLNDIADKYNIETTNAIDDIDNRFILDESLNLIVGDIFSFSCMHTDERNQQLLRILGCDLWMIVISRTFSQDYDGMICCELGVCLCEDLADLETKIGHKNRTFIIDE